MFNVAEMISELCQRLK